MVDVELRHFEDELEAVLSGATLSLPTAAIAWSWKTFTPKKGEPFLRTEMAGRDRRPLGIGADAVQEWTGIYQVGVFVPRDNGTRLQNQVASQVLKAFPRGLSRTTPQGLVMVITRSTAPPAVPWSDWSNQPVLVEWFAHEPP